MTEEIKAKLKVKIEELREIQLDYKKALYQRQQLDRQLNENIAVKNELDLLKPHNDVFKLIGPVLIKQDLEEAKQNVAKRMEYISAELKRADDMTVTLDKKRDTVVDAVQKYEQMLEEAQLKSSFSRSRA